MKRWMVLLVVAVWAVLAASGCVPAGEEIAFPGETAEDDTALVDDVVADAENSAVEGEPEADEAAENGQPEGQTGTEPARTVRIKLYFSDITAVETGITGETGYVKEITRELPHTQAVLKLALEELIRGPLPGEGNLGRTLPAATRLVSLQIVDRVALVDFSPELVTSSDSPAGTTGGAIFIQSVVCTATQFPTVDAVLVTVNGDTWSDGHFVWDEPLSRADLHFE